MAQISWELVVAPNTGENKRNELGGYLIYWKYPAQLVLLGFIKKARYYVAGRPYKMPMTEAAARALRNKLQYEMDKTLAHTAVRTRETPNQVTPELEIKTEVAFALQRKLMSLTLDQVMEIRRFVDTEIDTDDNEADGRCLL
jgi:hypothetical protein